MTVLISNDVPIAYDEEREPSRRLWTRAEYHKAAELGLFRADERLELIAGEVFRKVAPQSDPHASGVGRSADAMRQAFGAGFHVREEKPLVLNDLTEPEPDVVVVRGTWLQTPNHPTPANVVLVMEVSESTLKFDQTTKAASFARSGLADYWILNLRARQLEVRRDPAPLGQNQWGYASLQIIPADGQVSPLAASNLLINVADLLPLFPVVPPVSDAQNENSTEAGD